jgi:hypothetical protein
MMMHNAFGWDLMDLLIAPVLIPFNTSAKCHHVSNERSYYPKTKQNSVIYIGNLHYLMQNCEIRMVVVEMLLRTRPAYYADQVFLRRQHYYCRYWFFFTIHATTDRRESTFTYEICKFAGFMTDDWTGIYNLIFLSSRSSSYYDSSTWSNYVIKELKHMWL